MVGSEESSLHIVKCDKIIVTPQRERHKVAIDQDHGNASLAQQIQQLQIDAATVVQMLKWRKDDASNSSLNKQFARFTSQCCIQIAIQHWMR